MAEKFSFFDSQLDADGRLDREYNAQEFTDYFSNLVTTGIMKGNGDELSVSSNGSNMSTTIGTGVAYVQGRYYANTSPLMHTHDTEVLGRQRIDRIVIRLDLNTDARYVKSFIKKGVASEKPQPPALTRNEMVYEISLAQVKVVGGQTYIGTNDVTDERTDVSVAGWAGSKILPNFDADGLKEVLRRVDNMMLAVADPHHQNEDPDTTNKSLILTNTKSPFPGDFAYIRTVRWGVQKSQIATSYHTSPAAKMAIRSMYNGVWTPWIELITTNNMPKIPEVPTATTSRAGIVQLSDSISSMSSSYAATPYAVKSAYDRANVAYSQISSRNVGIGQNASASTDCVAVGYNATAKEYDSVAVGYNASANGRYTMALGAGARASMYSDAYIGVETDGTGPWHVRIPGQFSVGGSKQFEIEHPKPEKQDTHVIRHGAVESPSTGDTLYRYHMQIQGKKAHVVLYGENNRVTNTVTEQDGKYIVRIPLPDYWIHLNINDQANVNPDRHFGGGYAYVDRDDEILVIVVNTAGSYNIILYGTRNDRNVQNWYIRGVERDVGESWEGETYNLVEDEILTYEEIIEEETI